MFSRRFIKRIEKGVEKKLKRFYRETAFFCIDSIKFYLDEVPGEVQLGTRAGYEISGSEYKQVGIKFMTNQDAVKTVKEFVALFYHKIIETLDGYESFEVN